MVEVKIDAIRVNQMGSRVVILKELAANRYLSIWIGEVEANSIEIKLKNLRVVRPITHDLIVNLISEMGAAVRHVYISDLRDNIYHARVALRTRDGREMEIDSRASDAIAIAVRCEASIFVQDDVMDEHGQTPEEETATVADDDIGAFKDFLGSLDLDDLDK